MIRMLRRLAVTTAFAILASTAILHAQAPAQNTSTAETQVTGQHRGYNLHDLYLRLDNDKEMTFIVRIPGDTTDEWHNTFKTLSRITVTYHDVPGERHPVVTAIKEAK